MDFRDWLIAAFLAGAGLVSTVFLFLHPDPINFGTWATVFTTQTGVYHWLVIRDSKQADA